MAQLARHAGKEIVPIAKPDLIRFTGALPRTRSGNVTLLIMGIDEGGKEV
jgi:acetyl-CoA synthetase